ncbi:hypothetical protein ANME2D_02360 [Candidatus Methanoperedens nitroreducens]|uniref:Uncharacterized protein n=1 Tax=Candidatus Methanoperedens nitratireducens TaxID=1392998 RepID=A0A062V8B4_9EURY|nr:hypothetical protein [Candidatus Methanoperedens nitroreducens]KCZ71625.1 hypothetical protein ANME2D_02360 [Candidatus Methanoperedens nitroreducens]MDJ1421255.1 hypothetical protein [Candidatus Methanoperedens sp.]
MRMRMRLNENVRAQHLIRRAGAVPMNNASRKNIEVSVYGRLQDIYDFYPEVLDEIPTAEQVRVDPERGMIYKIPQIKQPVFSDLARQHGLTVMCAEVEA